MGLRAIERRLERLVEGTFARMFRTGVRPVELGRRLVREMDDHRSIGVNGRVVAPNAFHIRLAPQDHEQLMAMHESLIRELVEAAREHARDENYSFVGPVTIELEATDDLYTGQFSMSAKLAEGAGRIGTIVLPSGERISLGEFVATIGRLPECTVTLVDTNVSRHHAEIRPDGTKYRVVDLGSTNGTFVNGARVAEHPLADGDVITCGSTKIVFEAN